MASRNLYDLQPALQSAFMMALSIYGQKYPDLPQPFLTCTHRSNDEQAALYAQGRQPVEEINRLRKKAGMLAITKTEAKRRVTNARPGASLHNEYPARAFDIAFINSNKKLDWSTDLFKKFWEIIKTINPRMSWGGNWQSIKDYPHFQIEEDKNL